VFENFLIKLKKEYPDEFSNGKRLVKKINEQ